eukprot:gene419-496_t
MSNNIVGTLYHTPYFVSSVVAHAIYEMDIEDKVNVHIMGFDKMKDDFHLEKHPQGKIPFYTEGDDFTLIESSAILMHLIDQHDSEAKVLSNFKSVHQRAKFYQYLLNCPTQIYPNFVQIFIHAALFPEGHPMRSTDALTTALKTWNYEIAPYLVKELGDSTQWFLGDNFTAVDCLVGFNLVMASNLGVLASYPSLVAYLERLYTRPAFSQLYSEDNKKYLPTLERYAESFQRKAAHEAKLAAAKVDAESTPEQA